jgi:nucleoside-diphosphate-sugar epimerase
VKTALVLGAGGFIGHHLVTRLKQEGVWVRGVDLKVPEFRKTAADSFILGDLREVSIVRNAFRDFDFDEVYQLAADMGGAGFVFTGEHDADIMHNSATINLNVLKYGRFDRIFYSSSACMYPQENQTDPANPNCAEGSAYPANPDSEYGWEKLFSERLYLANARNRNLTVRIARYHNIFGPEGTWNGGREKAPAALCRKIVYAVDGGTIDIWGDGEQTRSFLYIADCLDATTKLMRSDFQGPVNIGSEQLITINDLAMLIAKLAGKKIGLKHIDGPLGVRGRCSDNKLMRSALGWEPSHPLSVGLQLTYDWIKGQVPCQSISTLSS